MNTVQLRRLSQEADDTYGRAAAGGLFYVIAWLVIGGYGGAFGREPALSWGIASALFGLSVVRFLRRPPREADAASRLRWLRVSWLIINVSTAIWGGIAYWAMRDPAFEPAKVAAILASMGLATAFAYTFAFRLGPAALGVALLCLPGLAVLWQEDGGEATALVASAYLIYLYMSLLRSHREYQHHLDTDQDLRDQRDLFARQSRVDALTDLANRRHFAEALAGATTQARAAGTRLSLLLLDIDHFKAINDAHGHAVGDGCLAAIAARLQLAFPNAGELPARIGGEEFGVILDGQGHGSALSRAESFRESLAAGPLMVDGLVLPVTISIGVSEFEPAGQKDVDSLYRAADRAVYRAKREGRNRVCSEGPLPVPGRDHVTATGES